MVVGVSTELPDPFDPILPREEFARLVSPVGPFASSRLRVHDDALRDALERARRRGDYWREYCRDAEAAARREVRAAASERCPTCGSNDPRVRYEAHPLPHGCDDAWHAGGSVRPQELTRDEWRDVMVELLAAARRGAREEISLWTRVLVTHDEYLRAEACRD